ncbi:hypothetical protein DAPPUDRAFT_114166 [Daphnia pulex]|uniref:Uncharacterized protein n=1 Tax=Daphnia pulex TaxID=6669 RepID=E9HH85_DAPPU|nr:hypothetical protein DAPPUDRAFT_114166 [Daphnia pulex]|eukprot:EFX68910.1 hypothetical protein DAPPUDRAFT_114166 [Daphnia pulex]
MERKYGWKEWKAGTGITGISIQYRIKEADGRFTKLDHVFARAAQKPILDIFKEICKTFDFRLPVFQKQQPLSNTKKNSVYELNNKQNGYSRMKKYPSVKAIILHEETPTEDPRQEHSRWILAN